jgi:hypothetical protein
LSLAGAPAHGEEASLSALDLPFSAFFKLPIGPRGLELGEQLTQADGKRVRLRGYMVAVEQAQPGRFLFTPRPIRLSEHADGEADDLPPATVTVLLDPSQRDRVVEHQAGLMALAGQLHLGRSEDARGRVSWFRLQLDPEALVAHRSLQAPAEPGEPHPSASF